jgi:hypothetical protein
MLEILPVFWAEGFLRGKLTVERLRELGPCCLHRRRQASSWRFCPNIVSIRLLGPVEPALQTRIVNNRSYTAAAGSVIDVLDSDAQVLQANGFIFVAPSGPTSARPAGTLGLYSAAAGSTFYDTTIGKFIVSDGVNWRDVSNGNSV